MNFRVGNKILTEEASRYIFDKFNSGDVKYSFIEIQVILRDEYTLQYIDDPYKLYSEGKPVRLNHWLVPNEGKGVYYKIPLDENGLVFYEFEYWSYEENKYVNAARKQTLEVQEKLYKAYEEMDAMERELKKLKGASNK